MYFIIPMIPYLSTGGCLVLKVCRFELAMATFGALGFITVW
jgi:hypothetical protein